MWFILGWITLLGFTWVFFRWRLANRWKGTNAHAGERSYEFALRKSKSKIQRILIGMSCDTPLEFCLKPESTVDRVFKSWGLSQEQSLDRLHFDEKVYIISDDARLSVLLKQHHGVATLLESLFDEQRLMRGRVRKLWCQKQRLWAECEPASGFTENDVGLLADEVVPLLSVLHDALQGKLQGSTGHRDPFILKAVLLLAISTALAVNGLIQGLRTLWVKFPVLIDVAPLWQTAVPVGTAMLLTLLALCIVWLGRTSRAHLILLELLLIGGAGCLLSAFTELRDYNIGFDASPAQVESVQVQNFYTTRCGKRNRSTCYHVALNPFTGVPDGLNLKLDQDTYQRLQGQQHLDIPIHQGALGWRWIEAPEAKTGRVY